MTNSPSDEQTVGGVGAAKKIQLKDRIFSRTLALKVKQTDFLSGEVG